ncbi:MAG: hypothetical protein WC455_12400 [Dehalococcoidia bacterium]|jgi:hypothetical protein
MTVSELRKILENHSSDMEIKFGVFGEEVECNPEIYKTTDGFLLIDIEPENAG